MTDKQRRFADEYLIDCNGARAYKAVYPYVKSEGAARACASKLLTNANIREYINERLEVISSEKLADVKEVIEYLTSVLRGESRSSVLSLCGDGCQEVIEKEPDEKERLKAAELLGKHFGMFTDNVRLSGDVGVQIVDDIPTGKD